MDYQNQVVKLLYVCSVCGGLEGLAISRIKSIKDDDMVFVFSM